MRLINYIVLSSALFIGFLALTARALVTAPAHMAVTYVNTRSRSNS